MEVNSSLHHFIVALQCMQCSAMHGGGRGCNNAMRSTACRTTGHIVHTFTFESQGKVLERFPAGSRGIFGGHGFDVDRGDE
jgi:hypothetical protein